VLAGGFDGVYGIGSGHQAVHRRGRVTRRDLLLQAAELDLHARAVDRASRARGRGSARRRTPSPATVAATEAAARNSSEPTVRETSSPTERHPLADAGVWARAAAQSRAARPVVEATSVQLTLRLGDEPGEPGERPTGLPEMTTLERMRAELEILGLDVSQHAVTTYDPFLDALGVTRSRDLLRRRSRSELLVAGVKVATQTPPIRSGRRVVFLTLDDGTGPVDATFFDDAQGPYAATIFSSWLLVVRGELRRTGPRGVSLRATGAWELPALHDLWRGASSCEEGVQLVRAELARIPGRAGPGGPARRRVLVHSSGFQMSPYSDVRPPGDAAKDVARRLWHRSTGSPG
jgi:error-prone DNA polymerase